MAMDLSQGAEELNTISNSKLTEEEASKLADELSLKLSEGVIPGADSDSLNKMVAGLGDQRGALRLTFAKSLHNVFFFFQTPAFEAGCRRVQRDLGIVQELCHGQRRG